MASQHRCQLKNTTSCKASHPMGPLPTVQDVSKPPGTRRTNRQDPVLPNVKHFNLSTYKLHALGDYVQTISLFSTTDSYSTQTVRYCPCHYYIHFDKGVAQGELVHRLVKHFYQWTNKKDAIQQITRHEHRHVRLHQARDMTATSGTQNEHYDAFSNKDLHLYTGVDSHHHINASENLPLNLFSFISGMPPDPAKKVQCLITNV